jgi:MFS family permease
LQAIRDVRFAVGVLIACKQAPPKRGSLRPSASSRSPHSPVDGRCRLGLIDAHSLVATVVETSESPARVYWTAFVGLFFDYYDLYLFVYLGKVLATDFALTARESDWLQFAGLAGVGAGALLFGYLADRRGRGKMMLAVFAVYAVGIAGVSLAGSYGSLLGFRLLASLSLGAEWGISHTYLAERVSGARRYRFSALLQFSILGGLLAALMARYVQPVIGWRWLFAASIVPVAVLASVRWRALTGGAEQGAGSRERGAGSGEQGAGNFRERERVRVRLWMTSVGSVDARSERAAWRDRLRSTDELRCDAVASMSPW